MLTLLEQGNFYNSHSNRMPFQFFMSWLVFGQPDYRMLSGVQVLENLFLNERIGFKVLINNSIP